eukprot:TRINITY_DN11483_c0_g2_i1.p1 TRINITY_DN11483_c0_g2~~TRINITY_DN11483_c0_g2_i1.p1  ORF type:complete len:362 (-),score=90.21 TRINITY_DN11483_c0_g2_i1:87-1172(-)
MSFTIYLPRSYKITTVSCHFSKKRLYHHFSSRNKDLLSRSKDKAHVFQALQYLRKLCSHPRLVLTKDHPEFYSIEEEISRKGDSLDSLHHAPKLLALKQLLHECGIGKNDCEENPMDAGTVPNMANFTGHRVLIFCQLRGMLDMIENLLFKAHMPDVTYMRMDGQTPTTKRVPMVKQFNEDPTIDCFLLTTSVGGLGLNLTGADTVIFMEHDWNPMKDLQAMDRAHRIGATHTVNVYRLITVGTLEEKIMGLQKFKLQTANSIINAENQSFTSMDTSTLLELFDLSPATATKSTTISSTGGGGAGGSTGLDELGNVIVGKGSTVAGAPPAAKAILDSLGELWEDSQYTEEFDLDNFVKGLK